MKNKNFKKVCPKCSRDIFFSRKSVLKLSFKNNSLCRSCCQIGKKFSNETKNKIKKSLIGKRRPKEICDKIIKSMSNWIGKPHSEETKCKLRMTTINFLKKRGILPSTRNYNPKACEFIDKLNKEKGWNLQHALNGGEVELYGYFVDGYDKEKNIIFEYDELSHERRNRKQKDLTKQNSLIKQINPVLFLRYNEKNNSLYEIK